MQQKRVPQRSGRCRWRRACSDTFNLHFRTFAFNHLLSRTEAFSHASSGIVQGLMFVLFILVGGLCSPVCFAQHCLPFLIMTGPGHLLPNLWQDVAIVHASADGHYEQLSLIQPQTPTPPEKANQASATRPASVLQPGNFAWVRDYHRLLVPSVFRNAMDSGAVWHG
ncbi:hypothetical protein F4604DRAFT_1811582 [Suillus subluteus]|nr:hypothetical protein F4604DRAFT_1811582 [Suillus subluteus]